MTRPPDASMRAAAAITSITMNGGTSLRPDGEISRFADSSMSVEPQDVGTEPPAPLLPHSAASVPGGAAKARLPGTNLPNLAQWLPVTGIIIGNRRVVGAPLPQISGWRGCEDRPSSDGCTWRPRRGI